ncbi:MAG: LuxR C-terminal-related transcriptional regulator [Gemmatimonadales bacterium]
MRGHLAVVLIEDNRLLREGIAALLRKQPDLRVVAVASRLDPALFQSRRTAPQVLLLDAGLGDHDSLGLAVTVKKLSPQTRVVVMGLLPVQDDVVAFVHAGVSGFILKDATADEFLRTIRAVAGGAKVLPSPLTDSLFSQIASDALRGGNAHKMDGVRMTQRERDVIRLIGDGLSNKEIAQQLHISIFTVKSHVHNILEKLALRTRVQIATYASQRSLGTLLAAQALAPTK